MGCTLMSLILLPNAFIAGSLSLFTQSFVCPMFEISLMTTRNAIDVFYFNYSA